MERSNGDDFSWEDFKSKFAEVFGTPDNRKFTIDQLLDYAHRKFGMTQEDLIEANKRSWERRRAWEERQANSDRIPEDWLAG